MATADHAPDHGRRPSPYPSSADVLTRRLPLGTFVHARSGDKGGDANLGLWVAHDGSEHREARVQWLSKLITPRRVRELVPEAADLEVDCYLLPNLGGVNVVIRGLLGEGVAASTRFDPQAKGLGEWVRSRHVSIEDGAAVTAEREALRATAPEFVRREVAPHLAGVGGRRRGAARAARDRGRARPDRRRLPRGGRRFGRRPGRHAWRCRRRCSRPGRPSGLMAALFTARHRAAAHRRRRRPRPGRPVRPARRWPAS